MPKGQQGGGSEEAGAIAVAKTRSRVITGWRHVAPPPRSPKWTKPVKPVT